MTRLENTLEELLEGDTKELVDAFAKHFLSEPSLALMADAEVGRLTKSDSNREKVIGQLALLGMNLITLRCTQLSEKMREASKMTVDELKKEIGE